MVLRPTPTSSEWSGYTCTKESTMAVTTLEHDRYCPALARAGNKDDQ